MRTKLFIGVFTLLTLGINAQFSVEGTVSDEDGLPLIGAAVIIKGTVIGVVADINGAYKIDVPGESATLLYQYTGFKSVEKEVSKSNNRVNVTLALATTDLDEVIVSGLATSVKRSNSANSVDYISSRELTEITQQSTMEGALYGKFKGAELRANSGNPGGGFSMRLRGVTALQGTKQPLYIVDGVYVNNSTTSFGNNVVSEAAGGGNQSTNQDDSSNRIADIDPEDIESIEILKGSSAAAIYGSRAANGVVIISTKRGKAGKTRVQFGQTIGMNSAIKLLGTRDWTEDKVREVYGNDDADLFAKNGNLDYENELYGATGLLSTSRLTVAGGNDKTKFFFGGTYKNDEGILPNTGYEKFSVRSNTDHQINDWLSIGWSNNFVNSTSERGFFNNSNSNTTIGYALAFTSPWEDLHPDENGNYPAGGAGSNVLETAELVKNTEDVNRYIGGLTANINLYTAENQNLRLVGRAGLDHYDLRTTSIFPRSLSYMQNEGSLGGVSISGTAINTDNNLEAYLVHMIYSPSGISFRTQLGVNRLQFDYNLVRSTASGLNGSQLNLGQSSVQTIDQTIRQTIDKGFFVQEEVNFSDQILFTAGIRGDKSSNNGDPNELFLYPKASLAVNLHEFDFMSDEGTLSNVKVRAAFGQAGTFADFGEKFTQLNSDLIGGASGLNVSGLRGNPDIGPQRNTEIEFGTDLGFLDNKILLDVTYYIRTTKDFLFRAQIPASTGFTRAAVNAGDLENKGIEIGLTAVPVSNDDFTWSTNLNFWTNQSTVTKLNIEPSTLDGFASSLGTFYIQEGESLTQIVGTFNPDDCDTGDCSDLDPDGDGLRVYGDAQPDFNMGWSNNLTYQNFSLSFMWHWKKGGEGINLSTLLYDLAGTTWDYDDMTLDPNGVLNNGDYRVGTFLGGSPIGFIEDAGYIRLREIGLYYSIPKSSLNDIAALKLGVSGRNLVNIFDYNSYDPEVSNFGNDVLGNAVEVTPYPSSKQVFFHLTATF